MEHAITFLRVRLVEINFREAGGIERAANHKSNRLFQMRIKEEYRTLFAQIVEKSLEPCALGFCASGGELSIPLLNRARFYVE